MLNAGGVRALAFTPSGQTFASGGGGDCSVTSLLSLLLSSLELSDAKVYEP